MDRQAQLKRLVWLSSTEIQERKRYAWNEAKALDRDYPGISTELAELMRGQVVSTESENPTQQRRR